MRKHARSPLRVVPFEVALAGVAIYQGAKGVLHLGITTDPLRELLHPLAADVLNGAYVCAGVAMLLGVKLDRPGLESVGLWLVATSIVGRAVAAVYLLPWQLGLDALITGGLFLWACVVRYRELRRGAVIVRTVPRGS